MEEVDESSKDLKIIDKTYNDLKIIDKIDLSFY
jgi:hypothetical protein